MFKAIVPACLIFVLPALASAATAPAELSPAARQAFQVLAHAESYAPGPVGIAAEIPATVTALGRILKDPAAASAFEALLSDGTLPAQLFALNGLYLLDADDGRTRILEFAELHVYVPTQFGCIGRSQPFSELAERIASGEHPNHLAYVLSRR